VIALVVIGFLLILGGGISLLISQFQTSLLWGLGSLLLPVVGLAYIFIYWQDAKNAFFVQCVGAAFLVAAFLVAPAHAVVSN
jgi:uncharacterized membrane protein